jgi:hypothetical protein
VQLSTSTTPSPPPKFSLGQVEYEPLLYIVQNMCEKDRHEILATLNEMDPGEANELITQTTLDAATKMGIGWIGYRGDEPIAVFGMSMIHSNVAQVWMFTTDRWPLVALSLTRFAKKTIIPLLQDSGIRRAQCFSMDTHTVAHRRLNMLGATEECNIPNYGKNGESFRLFAWSEGRDF